MSFEKCIVRHGNHVGDWFLTAAARCDWGRYEHVMSLHADALAAFQQCSDVDKAEDVKALGHLKTECLRADSIPTIHPPVP